MVLPHLPWSITDPLIVVTVFSVVLPIITLPVTESTSNTVSSLVPSHPFLTDNFLETALITVSNLNISPWSSTPSLAGVPSSREIIT